MRKIKYLIAITNRDNTEKYLDFFHRHGEQKVFYSFCEGTANQKTLSYLGIENTERVAFETIIRDEDMPEFIKDLYLELDIGAIGSGLALFIPIDGVGGMSSLKYFVGDNPVEKEKEEMANESKNVLIIAVADKGNVDMIMEAARNAGASGGTVVKAKGTGAEIAKFFGVSISEEKEMIYIVSKREDRDNIMRAIMEKAGANTDAHGVVFSLPVDKVVGIKHFEDM